MEDEARLLFAEPLLLTGSISEDIKCLRRITVIGEQALARLPPKPARGLPEQQAANSILEHGRKLRAIYLRRYAQVIYDVLTRDRTIYLRLDALLDVLGQHYPGLSPSEECLSADRGRIQAHKEGFEIDLGIIVQAFLRVPAAGMHLMDAMLRPSTGALALLPVFREDNRLDLGTVSIERRDEVGYITLRGTENLNAEDVHLVKDLETAIDLVLLDDRIRVGVLRGGVMTHRKYAGRRIFCAGINLRALREGRIGLVEFLLTRELGLINKLRSGLLVDPAAQGLDRLEQKPWVAAVEGFAIGGGMQLLFAFDHVIAAEDAFFSLPAANEGIVPGAANLRITRQMGSRLARSVILSGRRITASDPAGSLICDEIVNGNDIDEALSRAVEVFASPAVTANRKMLNMAEERPEDFQAYMAEFAVVQARRAHSADVLAKLDRNWN